MRQAGWSQEAAVGARTPWTQGWLTGELEAINVSLSDPTEPNGSGVSRVADDVDRVQARLLDARRQVAAQAAQIEWLDTTLSETARSLRDRRGDTALAFLAGLILGVIGLTLVLYLSVP